MRLRCRRGCARLAPLAPRGAAAGAGFPRRSGRPRLRSSCRHPVLPSAGERSMPAGRIHATWTRKPATRSTASNVPAHSQCRLCKLQLTVVRARRPRVSAPLRFPCAPRIHRTRFGRAGFRPGYVGGAQSVSDGPGSTVIGRALLAGGLYDASPVSGFTQCGNTYRLTLIGHRFIRIQNRYRQIVRITKPQSRRSRCVRTRIGTGSSLPTAEAMGLGEWT